MTVAVGGVIGAAILPTISFVDWELSILFQTRWDSNNEEGAGETRNP